MLWYVCLTFVLILEMSIAKQPRSVLPCTPTCIVLTPNLLPKYFHFGADVLPVLVPTSCPVMVPTSCWGSCRRVASTGADVVPGLVPTSCHDWCRCRAGLGLVPTFAGVRVGVMPGLEPTSCPVWCRGRAGAGANVVPVLVPLSCRGCANVMLGLVPTSTTLTTKMMTSLIVVLKSLALYKVCPSIQKWKHYGYTSICLSICL